LDISIILKRDGTMWAELSGSAALKSFLRQEFGSIIKDDSFRAAVIVR
jgi:hypothetical protein